MLVQNFTNAKAYLKRKIQFKPVKKCNKPDLLTNQQLLTTWLNLWSFMESQEVIGFKLMANMIACWIIIFTGLRGKNVADLLTENISILEDGSYCLRYWENKGEYRIDNHRYKTVIIPKDNRMPINKLLELYIEQHIAMKRDSQFLLVDFTNPDPSHRGLPPNVADNATERWLAILIQACPIEFNGGLHIFRTSRASAIPKEQAEDWCSRAGMSIDTWKKYYNRPTAAKARGDITNALKTEDFENCSSDDEIPFTWSIAMDEDYDKEAVTEYENLKINDHNLNGNHETFIDITPPPPPTPTIDNEAVKQEQPLNTPITNTPKPAHSSDSFSTESDSPDNTTKFVIAAIIGEAEYTAKDGPYATKTMYFVSWKGFDRSYDTWEPKSSVIGTPQFEKFKADPYERGPVTAIIGNPANNPPRMKGWRRTYLRLCTPHEEDDDEPMDGGAVKEEINIEE